MAFLFFVQKAIHLAFYIRAYKIWLARMNVYGGHGNHVEVAAAAAAAV